MLKKPDFFVRRVKYSLPPNRKLRLEFEEKKYETKIVFNDKQNLQEYLQTFLSQKSRILKADDFEIVRNDKIISKANVVNDLTLKHALKIVPFELNREKFHIENNIPIQAMNFGFNLSGQYLEEKDLGSNFFVYLKHKIDPKRYEIQKDLIAEKTHEIKASYNTAVSKLLEQRFYKKMKDMPNSGYDKMGKFIVGIFDSQFYKQLMSNVVTHVLDINYNSTNTNNKMNFNSNIKNAVNNKFLVDIDFAMKGIFTPEVNLNLLVRKEDFSIMLPITFARHTNDILNYKKFMEWFLMTGKDIATQNIEKNEKQIKPTFEERLAKLKKTNVGIEVYKDMLGRSFEQLELHSFVNYNALKIKSHFKTQTGKKMHFGAAFVNDKFRFQLLVNHQDQRLIDNFCLSKSKVFNFEIDPNTITIKNVDAIKDFIDHLNLISKIPDEELYQHYLNFEKLYKQKYFEEVQDEVTLENIREKLSNKFRPKVPKETSVSQKANEIELDILEKLNEKQSFNANI